MSWEKEWGKILFNREGINDFLLFAKNNNIDLDNNKNITLTKNTVYWISEGENAVTEDHKLKNNKIFWNWVTQVYVFKEEEICVINLIDQKLKKAPIKNQEVKISTLLFNSENSEELKYSTIDLYENNTYLFS
jgi:hypothetical protein